MINILEMDKLTKCAISKEEHFSHLLSDTNFIGEKVKAVLRTQFPEWDGNGFVLNDLINKARTEAAERNISYEEIIAEKTQNVPLNKYASINDVCHAVDGLLSHFSDHMTGSNFMCDGGFLKVY